MSMDIAARERDFAGDITALRARPFERNIRQKKRDVAQQLFGKKIGIW